MFELPPGGKVEEGLSDNYPIVLRGDKASEIRSVLKYMYAGVMHTQINKIPLAALPGIMAVATFANNLSEPSFLVLPPRTSIGLP
ncbi:hypothetical protein DFH09DRAFT_1310736 [Mycena vulgaris]|nr:hypothetical protein DFH09DRAFT_1310736 [Mycena vulgaris]